MRQFYLTFPNRHALRDDLSWTHYRLLMRVENEKARNFYLEEAVKAQWSTRQLELQINTLFYERLLSSHDKQSVAAEIQTLEPSKSDAIVKYTLPENETQIFASKYKLYLPTEEELRKELSQEYNALESGKAGDETE